MSEQTKKGKQRPTHNEKLSKDGLESVDYFHSAFEYAAIGMAVLTLNGRFTRVNRALAEMVGYSPEELIDMSFPDITSPDDSELRFVRQLLKGEINSFQLEKKIVHKGGKPVWVWLSGSIVRDADQTPLFFITQLLNITNRKQAEEEQKRLKEQAAKDRKQIDHLVDHLKQANATLLTLIDVMPVGVLVCEQNGTIAIANPAAKKIFGGHITGSAFHSQGPCALFHLDGSPFAPDDMPLVRSLRDGQAIHEVEMMVRCRNGEESFVLTSSNPVMDEECRIVGALAVMQDMTFRKKYEDQLRENDETLRAFFDAITETLVLTDADKIVLAVNDAGSQRIGKPQEGLVGKSISDSFPPRLAERTNRYLDQVIMTGLPLRFEESRDGRYWGNAIYPVLNKKGYVSKLAYFSQDVTQNKLIEKALLAAKEEAEAARANAEKIAFIDYLTGVLNRRAFIEHLASETARVKRGSGLLSVIILDIDDFKKVNDSFGHRFGDEVLIQVAKILQKGCRTYDSIGRHGGEEFVICLPNTGEAEGYHVAERLRSLLADISLTPAGSPVSVTASFGVAQFDDSRDTVEILIHHADLAMYQAKKLGKNRVCCYSNIPGEV